MVSTIVCSDERATAREAIESSPSAAVVTGLFNQIMEVTFPVAPGSGSSIDVSPDRLKAGKASDDGIQTSSESPDPAQRYSARVAALRQILSEAIDADGVSHFVLGRYANAASTAQIAHDAMGQPVRSPTDGFLDFASNTVAKLGPGTSPRSPDRAAKRPTLTIFNMTMGHDQTRLVTSELALPNGQVLPLTWKVVSRAGALKIEDVECLGISMRLMLRSAVARAAAEHPDDVSDLGRLLGAAAPFGETFGRTPPTSPASGTAIPQPVQ